MEMPWVKLAGGQLVQVPVGPDGMPDWAAVAGQLAPPASAPIDARHIPLREFRARISPEGKSAIYAAAETTPLVRAWLDDLAAADPVNLDDPMLVYALDWLVAHAGLSPEDAAAVRA